VYYIYIYFLQLIKHFIIIIIRQVTRTRHCVIYALGETTPSVIVQKKCRNSLRSRTMAFCYKYVQLLAVLSALEIL